MTSKRDVPKRLASSTPAGNASRVSWEAIADAAVGRRASRAAELECGEGRRWKRLRAALKGKLRLGRSTDRFGGSEALLATKRTEVEPLHPVEMP